MDISAQARGPARAGGVTPLAVAAGVGVVLAMFEAYLIIRWVTGPNFRELTSGPSVAPTWMQVAVPAGEIVGVVEHLAERLGLPLVTVSCHEDMLAADLVGRFLLEGGDTVWQDGPLTRAVRQGGICYLDEIVEARSDATVAIHSLADHRRQLFVERRDELLTAPPGFMLMISYNPGYQNLLKDLKSSTRQRFVAVELSSPPPELEARIVTEQSGADPDTVRSLVRLGGAVRELPDPGLSEVVSTRALITAARQVVADVPLRRAASSAVSASLTDDPELTRALDELIDAYLC